MIVGALAGSFAATLVPNRVFQPLLLGTMIVMALGMLLSPGALAPPPGTEPRRVMGRPLAMLLTLATGFYGGILQAGAGFLILALLGGALRYDLVRANALKAVVMLAYIVVTVAVFAARGKVAWAAAVAMTVGAVVGAWIGAHLAMRRGQGLIRWIVIGMVIVSCVVVFVRSR